jgi:DNA-binding MarR family transcriptional regulator
MIRKTADDDGQQSFLDNRSLCDDMLSAMRRIIQLIDLHSKHLVKKFGLTGPQLIILQEISRAGEISASEIAKAISLSQATVTGILDRLEKRELVLRRRSYHDRRRVMLKITPQGAELLQAAPPPMQERFTFQFVRLQRWEQYMILSSLHRILSMMGSEGTSSTAPVFGPGSTDTETHMGIESSGARNGVRSDFP